MPEMVADEKMAQKIKNGVMLTKAQISCRNNSPAQSGPYLKVVDRRKNLLAVVCDRKVSDYYHYCCVLNT
jgi:hypothetical protein